MKMPESKGTKFDYAIVCANCGDIYEEHDWDDYDGTTCVGKNNTCNCEEWKPKVENGKYVYKLEE